MEPRSWLELSRWDVDAWLRVLQGESPQVIALVLSQLTSESAAHICKRLPSEALRTEVLLKLAHLVLPSHEAVAVLRQHCQERLVQVHRQAFVARGGVDHAARLLEAADPSMGARILAELKHTSPDVADKLLKALASRSKGGKP